MKRSLMITILLSITVAFSSHCPLYSLSISSLWAKITSLHRTKKINQEETITIRSRIAIFNICESFDCKKTSLNLIDAAKNNNIDGIIVLIDSCGGAASSFAVCYDLLKEISSIKPVVALVLSEALSCGYLLASPAHYIIAHTLSRIGGIGVYCEVRRDKELKVTGEVESQMTVNLFKAGEFKTIYHPYEKELAEHERAYIQNSLIKSYQLFKNIVASNRNLDLDDANRWAEGKTFNTKEALSLGLIDQIGNFFDAEQKIIELIKEAYPSYDWAAEIEPILYQD